MQDFRTQFNNVPEEEVVSKAKAGDNPACEFLLDKYRSLVKTISRKYYIAGADNEDVIQEGTIGLFKAIRNYSPDGGTAFKTFASLCIERQIQTAVSGANREKHKILTESIPLEGGEDNDAVDESVNPEKLAVMKETLERVIELGGEVLSPLESQVFRGMLLGENYHDIAAYLGVTPKSVDNAIQRVRKKIQL